MNKERQEKILMLPLHEALNRNEIHMLWAMSEGKSVSQINKEGLGGWYYSEWHMYTIRRGICKKIDMKFGKGSRKLHWLAGRYYRQIQELYWDCRLHEHSTPKEEDK